jgi:hypothetical protein
MAIPSRLTIGDSGMGSTLWIIVECYHEDPSKCDLAIIGDAH